MPELPEVESARRSLGPLVRGRTIATVEVRTPASVRTHSPAAFARLLRGQTITAVSRRGKILLFTLSGGWTLAFHFKLWGMVRWTPSPEADPQANVTLTFTGGTALQFRELQLSELGLYRTDALDRVEYLATLGIEPLSAALTRDRFRALMTGRGTVHGALTDQERLAGIGNLWAHEICHAARIRPDRRLTTLTSREVDALYRAVRTVLRRAVAAGGEPEFADARGRRGRARLAVYDRAGQRCPRSDGTIVAARIGGRPSFYCPRCQR
ncbi:MAG: DNA-formamidopyrimidine glycosylase family protein [Armatimonadota bacterium]|nr:DNA-formamidopyrimidine glycosylase family protein [Armatimonadota bacterium]MDR7403704.1 DNA-formamidopyrimidine glycosylase family protein [Armatimonadota bacterium]